MTLLGSCRADIAGSRAGGATRPRSAKNLADGMHLRIDSPDYPWETHRVRAYAPGVGSPALTPTHGVSPDTWYS